MTTTPLQMLSWTRPGTAPTLASASNHSAFNLANAGGAWLGGVAISAGWGWTSPRWSARSWRGRPGIAVTAGLWTAPYVGPGSSPRHASKAARPRNGCLTGCAPGLLTALSVGPSRAPRTAQIALQPCPSRASRVEASAPAVRDRRRVLAEPFAEIFVPGGSRRRLYLRGFHHPQHLSSPSRRRTRPRRIVFALVTVDVQLQDPVELPRSRAASPCRPGRGAARRSGLGDRVLRDRRGLAAAPRRPVAPRASRRPRFL